MNVYNLIPPPVLTAIARALVAEEDQRPQQSSLNFWFPSDSENALTYSYLTGTTRSHTTSAPFRAFSVPSPIGTRPGRTRISGEIPPISLKYPLTELGRHQQQALINDTTLAITAESDIIDDITTGIRAIYNRFQLAMSDLLVNSSLVFSENGIDVTQTVTRKASRVATAGIPWSTSATAVPHTNERAMLKVLRDEEDLMHDDLIAMCNEDTYDEYLACTSVISDLQTVRQASGPLSEEEGTLVRRQRNLPNIVVNNRSIADAAGTLRKVIPDGKWLYLPKAARVGTTRFGTPAAASLESINLKRSEQAGPIAYLLEGLEPVGVTTVVDALGIPIFQDPDATAVINV